MRIKAPIREALFSSPGILSKMWVKFFINVEEEASSSSSSEGSMALNAPNSINSTEDEASKATGALALTLLPSQISTRTGEITTDDTLTLYWMGV